MPKKKSKARQRKQREYAVIDIGSSAIRIVIAEIKRNASWNVVDSAFQPVSLGKDVFTTGVISRDTMVQCLQILNSFREMMAGWQVADHNVKVIATSALREAKNRDTFIDQVHVRTGFDITIVEGIEANQLTYVAVRQALRKSKPRFSQTNSIIMEVGGGSTEIMLLQRGKMVAAHTLHIGTVRIEEQIKSAFGSGRYLARFLQENIRTTRDVLDGELPLKRIRHFVAVGGDARLAASIVGQEEGAYRIIEKDTFADFVSGLQDMSTDEIVHRYHIPYDEAEPLTPALLVYQQILDATSAQRLTVPNVSIRDGVLLSVSTGTEDHIAEEFYSQVTASAKSLGKKYHIDEQHARHVAQLSLSLFDQLTSEHGMDKHQRLMLEVAALLHDIGSFVNPSSHHKHGQYIVANSDIFGLRPEEIQIIANVVRYHRRALPDRAHENYMALTREERVQVMKMAAILRIADALDRGHRQKMTDIKVETTTEELLIRAEPGGDLSLSRFALKTKGDMFEEVFGLKPALI